MTSVADVRYGRVSVGSANLVVDQGIANIFHQSVNLLCILWVFKETRKVLRGYHRVHSSSNLFQFPGNHRASDSVPDLGEYGPTVPAYSPSPPHRRHPER